MSRARQQIRRRASVPISYLIALSFLPTLGLVPRLMTVGQLRAPQAATGLFEEQLADTLDRMGETRAARHRPPSGMLLAQATEEPECEPTMEPGCEPTMEPGCEPTMDPGCEPTMDPGCEPTMDPGCEPTMDPGCEPTMDPGCEPTMDPGCEPTMDPGCGPTMDPANPDCQEPPPTEDPANPECQDPQPTEDPECVAPTEDPECPANPVSVAFDFPGDGAVVSGAGIGSMVTITVADGGPPVTITCTRGYTDGELQYEDDYPWMADPGDYGTMGPGLWAHPLATPSGHSFSIEVEWERMWMGGGDSGMASDTVNFTVDNTPTIAGVTIDPGGEVKGTVMLEAIAAPAGAGQGGGMEMWSDYIDKVEFYVGGAKIGEVLGEYAEPVEPDPPMGPAYVESIYRLWWNSAEWENCAPKWPDGDYEVKAKAVAGGSWAETTPVTATVHNKGSVAGQVYEVKDGEEVGIEGATVKAFRCGEVKEEATTDDGGNYDMELYPGCYTLKAEHINFVTGSQGVCLSPQEAKENVDFELERRIQVYLPQTWSVVDPWLPEPDKYRSGEGIPADGKTETICSVTVKTQEGEWVPDGTVVTFTTDQGSFDPETATTTGGAASSTLTAPESETDLEGEVTVTADGAEAKVDTLFKAVKFTLQVPDQSPMGGDFPYEITITYPKCAWIESIRAFLWHNDVWTPLNIPKDWWAGTADYGGLTSDKWYGDLGWWFPPRREVSPAP